MKKFLFALALCVCFQYISAQTLHGIIFAETDDDRIGATCDLDYKRVSTEMSMIATANNMYFKQYFFKGSESSLYNLKQTLNNIKCGPKDIVFFYYSGHGARSMQEQTKFPQMCIDHGGSDSRYPLHKVYTQLMDKNPQLCIVIGDLCNSIDPYLLPKGLEIDKAASTISTQTENAYKSLFSKLSGGIIACSSEPGETSGCNLVLGGFFTNAFLVELGRMVNGSSTPNWKTLLENARNDIYEKQKPQFDIDVRPAGSNTISNTNNGGTSDELIAALVKMSDANPSTSERIKLIPSTLERFFSKDAIVEIYGKNGTTLLERESASDYLERVATAYKLINFAKLSVETDNNGKIKKLKIHEIYKK